MKHTNNPSRCKSRTKSPLTTSLALGTSTQSFGFATEARDVQHAQRENAFSKHRSRTLMPTCLLQLQFLCAQHHLECGHWQTRTWPVIKTPLQGDCAFFNKRTIPKAQRCGSSLGYSRLATRHNSSAKTHLRQQPGADPHTSRAIRNKFTHTEGRSSFAPGLCEIRAQATFSSSFKVRVTAGRCNGEHRGPVR